MLLLVLLGGCVSGGEVGGEPGGGRADGPGTAQPSEAPVLMLADADPDGELRDELLAMLERDQAGRTGGVDEEGDAARTERLGEIIDTFGWPTASAVGEEAATAAWAIAQHSDLDPAFQERALGLLEIAVAEGEGSPGDLAYLTDRVAAGAGDPQTYGTQIGCSPQGAAPSVPIVDEANVDARRAEAGLPPLADYLAELDAVCAEEATG